MTDEVTDLAALGAELLGVAHESPEGRAARVVEHGPRQRAVVMALAGGTELNEHSSPGAATLQVLSGRARLVAGERTWNLPAGSLVPIPPKRHRVETEEDTVMLLTVALG